LRLLLDNITIVDQSVPKGIASGSVLVSDGQRLEVATSDGVLSLRRVQPAGKRVMAIEEFLRGHPIPVGDRFES
jgi:methionyl-tRNA formyltransferase